MKEKKIDMHMHTNFSDGELTPEELIKRAIDHGVTTMAITDHDTIKGIESVDKEVPYIKESGIEIWNGVELSAKVPKGRMHILGYGMNLQDPNLQEVMKNLKEISLNSFITMLEQVKRDYHLEITYEDILEVLTREHNIGRPDIARILVKRGYAKTGKEAFQKYLVDVFNKTRPYRKGLSYEECLEAINKSGGVAVLAHPKSLELSEKEFLILLRDMIKKGLKGIEAYHSSHTKEEMAYYEQIAKEYNLLISGGSDYHGKIIKPDIEVGSGKKNNLKIKQLTLVDYLHKK